MTMSHESPLKLIAPSGLWGFVVTLLFVLTILIPGWNMIHYILFMAVGATLSPLAQLGVHFPGKTFEILASVGAIVGVWVIVSALRFTFLFSMREQRAVASDKT